MNIEQIPSDELVVMTESWHRAFKAAGCNPTCHCCSKKIAIGSKFKLATIKETPKLYNPQSAKTQLKEYDKIVESKEVMLCEECTPELFDKKQKKQLKRAKRFAEQNPDAGCFRINGKIVH